ncbi:hypothetical protein PRIPAC_96888 [Pristionchus pacificus]|uniref:Uncharacterized protein n=1 Tax=Pristionchus pacificus TaxID=54126 RepID=A0A2A6BCJ5_PRIPA|nr:hypothetical protein PRIPAC_96888 [Pristionchus pacificus]|eukprot:PDM63584.1 hypothetical protein PRIPAC_49557 [Pristionchus pacificus]
MTQLQTTADHHQHMFIWLGGFIAAFILFFTLLKISHKIDKLKLCCPKKKEEVVNKENADVIDIEMDALSRSISIHVAGDDADDEADDHSV